MNKIWRVAFTEYLNAVRSKAFILGVLALPLIMAISVGVQLYAQKKTDLTPRRFAVLDRSGHPIHPLRPAPGHATNRSAQTTPRSQSR